MPEFALSEAFETGGLEEEGVMNYVLGDWRSSR